MAFTLRLEPDEAEALRLRAEHEGRSMHEIARKAIREYVSSHNYDDIVEEVFRRSLTEDAEMLRRLADQ